MSYKSNKSYTINKKGGYESLVVYWLGVTISDLTAIFTEKYIKSYRTRDQMNQAARSGKQCIVEGSLENSVEGNLKLTGVAKASYGELLEDGKDYLRQNGLKLWDKDYPRVLQIRATRDLPNMTYKTYTSYIGEAESFTNLLITLCYKQMFLLDRLLAAIEKKFIKEGGFRENLFRKRQEYLRK